MNAPEPTLVWSWKAQIANYDRVSGFPASLFVAGDGRVVGTWILGNDYQTKSAFYGGYPPNYLRRIAALFPDKRRALHLFSGMVDVADLPGDTVDVNPALRPTFLDDAQTLKGVPIEDYDLVVADPPYSHEDADRYGTTLIKPNAVMRALTRLGPGAHVVWLDQRWPMYRKSEWDLEAVWGVIRSTNHRVRQVFVFRRRRS